MFDETPKIDFTVKDDSGLVIFRDALIFSSMSELRNTSSDERQAIMQKRYDDYKASLDNKDIIENQEVK